MNNVIVILNFNDYENTSRLIDRIINYMTIQHIVVVDNCSTDNSYEKLIDYNSDRIHIIQSDHNGGYSYGNNLGIIYAVNNFVGIDNIIISNPDVDFPEDTIKEMEKCLLTLSDVALVGAIVKNFDGDIDPCLAWVQFDYELILRGHLKLYSHIANFLSKKKLLYDYKSMNRERYYKVGTVHGCFFMIRLQEFIKIGLFDERTFLYGEEDMISYKLSHLAGNCRQEAVATNAVVYHKGSGTIKKNQIKRSSISIYSYKSRLIYLQEYLHVNRLKIAFYKLIAHPKSV